MPGLLLLLLDQADYPLDFDSLTLVIDLSLTPWLQRKLVLGL